ncbi:MAG: phospholipid carrier-dependent glycosyltransferase [Candidatus Portnoybacteria bacterium]|nr:phospholipid carrier-dependent glycosyltransferase [Candidatus Portnoybacteria bacterium]
MSKKLAPIFSILLIALMLVLATISLRQESAIMDEVAHTPAGYSYLTQQDMRLNPEHPPLLKDLSAVPLLFVNDINFPDHLDSWQNKVNGQWNFGFNFLYEVGNDADEILFWSRLPMLLLLALLAFFIYRWTKELYGKWTGFLAVFLFSFAPTFIAHGRYVTTDVGAAFGFFIGIYYFVKYLQSPTKKNLILSGIFFGIAQLIKFSLFLLIPYFGVLILFWVFLKRKEKKFWPLLFKYIGRFLLIMIIGYILVYPVYLFHVSGYPAEKQISDTDFISSHFPIKPVNIGLVWMAEKPVLRPYAQYLLGLFMVFQRATGGNTTYFLGDVTNKGWHHYFPIVYLIKTPLALHFLTIVALLFLVSRLDKRFWKNFFGKIGHSFRVNFAEWAMLIFLVVYWASSITSNLNIGVRHVLPVFPFIYILISGQLKRLYDAVKKNKNLLIGYFLVLFVLLTWYAYSSLSIFPYYLTHFNELVGGAEKGHIYVTDSNLDWGQDLKRLSNWVDEKGIDKIKVDYFGGATVKYYLGDKYEEWHAEYDPKKAKNSWLAVSATFLQQNRAIPTKGWSQPTDQYLWLYQYEPVEIIGNSIFVYYID